MKKRCYFKHVDRIKQALARNAQVRNFKPTLYQSRTWFKILNSHVFNNTLKIPSMTVARRKEIMGQCTASWDARVLGRKGKWNQRKIPYSNPTISYQIDMHHRFDTWRDFLETMAHEMVHLYQMTVLMDPYANHNKHFFRFRNKFKKFGLNLTR